MVDFEDPDGVKITSEGIRLLWILKERDYRDQLDFTHVRESVSWGDLDGVTVRSPTLPSDLGEVSAAFDSSGELIRLEFPLSQRRVSGFDWDRVWVIFEEGNVRFRVSQPGGETVLRHPAEMTNLREIDIDVAGGSFTPLDELLGVNFRSDGTIGSVELGLGALEFVDEAEATKLGELYE